jgi:hypothetical protein
MPFDQIPDEFVVEVGPFEVNGVNSRRVQFGTVSIPSTYSSQLPYGVFEELVYPLAAVSTSHEGRTTCNTATVWDDDCISRVSVFVSKITLDGTPMAPDPNWVLLLQVRASNVCIPMGMRQYRFEFVPGSIPAGKEPAYRSGLVAQYGGPLCTQFEVWGCIDTLDPMGPRPPDGKVTLTLAVDRLASVEDSVTSPSTIDDGKTLLFPLKY